MLDVYDTEKRFYRVALTASIADIGFRNTSMNLAQIMSLALKQWELNLE